MYTGRGKTGLGDWSDIFGDILSTGEQIVKDIKTPVYTNPSLRLPTTPPFIDPRTGQFLPQATSGLSMPLLIGGGLVLLVLLTRGGRR